jgi:hypothetical protein
VPYPFQETSTPFHFTSSYITKFLRSILEIAMPSGCSK